MARQARNVLAFKLQATSELLTANAGLAVFGEFVRAVGVHRWVEQSLPAPGSAAGYFPQNFVSPLILMLCGGGRSPEDLRQIYNDKGLRHLLKLDETPSTDAVGDWLRRMGGGSGLTGLGEVKRRIVAMRLRKMDTTQHTLDIDASQIIAQKEAAKYTYKGEQGCMPMVGHLAQAGVVLHEEFREGNAAPASANLEFIQDCQAAMPKGQQIKRLRADSATYQADIFNYLDDKAIEFAIGGRWSESVKTAVQNIAESAWKKFADCAIAEIVHAMGETKRAFRLVVVRRQTQAEIFDDEGQAADSKLLPKYTLVASNFDASKSAHDIYVWYCQRGQASENGIKELKIGFGMERMSCGQLSANAVFFRIGAIAHNLFVLFKKCKLCAGDYCILLARWSVVRVPGCSRSVMLRLKSCKIFDCARARLPKRLHSLGWG